ncbi:MAG: hypothetical protein ABIA63_05795, partial [bacterium]
MHINCDTIFSITQEITGELHGFKKNTVTLPDRREVLFFKEIKPLHVQQKIWEIFEKIGKYRVKNGLGNISIPPYPSMPVSLQDLYPYFIRILEEIRIINTNRTKEAGIHYESSGKTIEHIYKEIEFIAAMLDAFLGIESYTPNEVYQLSWKILAEARFLRKSQCLDQNIPPPPKSEGKQSNHSLKQANDILDKIRTAQINLWMTPCRTRNVPRRIITPGEVYEALLENLAEMQRIKYRLGLEFTPIISFRDYENKTPDDVIYNLKWAADLLPVFNEFNIRQVPHSRALTYADKAFSLARLALRDIKKLRTKKNISRYPKKGGYLHGDMPDHVFYKTLECLKKINGYREKNKMGRITIPGIQIIEPSPKAAYDITVRLFQEIKLLTHGDFQVEPEESAKNKTFKDVYNEIKEIYRHFLTFLPTDEEDFYVNEIYELSENLSENISELYKKLKITDKIEVPPVDQDMGAKVVYEESKNIFNLLKSINVRAGLETGSQIKLPKIAATAEDILDLQIINKSEFYSLAGALGISLHPG